MKTQSTKYTWIMMSVMLMLAFGSLAARAQDNSSSTTTPAPSTSTTTTSDAPTTMHHSSSSEGMQGMGGLSTNTWILIAIGGVAVLVLIVVIARSNTTKETISRTTVIK